jgi:hypothetical protein
MAAPVPNPIFKIFSLSLPLLKIDRVSFFGTNISYAIIIDVNEK